MASLDDNHQFRKLLQAYPAKAIEMLYERFEDSLKKLASNLTQDGVVAEDIVQEAFVVIWENYKQLAQHHDLSIEHYLVRIVRNKSVDYFKEKIMNKVVNDLPLNDHGTVEKSVETSMIEQEVSHSLRALVEKFPKRERECLLMRIDDELSYKEIANILDVTTKAVDRSLTSARRRLRKYWIASDFNTESTG